MSQQITKSNFLKIGCWVAGFLLPLFTLFFPFISLSADEITDAEIAAFYHQMISDDKSSINSIRATPPQKLKQPRQQRAKHKIKQAHKLITKRKPIKARKPTKKRMLNKANKLTNTPELNNNADLNRNDPALIAFYESLLIDDALPKVSLQQKQQEKVNAVRNTTEKTYDKSITNLADDLYVDIDDKGKVTPPLIANKIIRTPAKVEVMSSSREDTLDSVETQVDEETSDSTLPISQNSNKTALKNQGVSNKEPKSPSPKSSKASDLDALFAKAFGKKAAKSTPAKLKAELRINASTIGEVELYSNTNTNADIDRVDTATLIELLKEVLKDHVYLRVKKELSSSKKTTFSKLEQLGIEAVYNSTNLSLDITIQPELRKPQILSLLKKKKSSVRKENKITAENISAFLNAYSNIGINSVDQSKPDLRMRLEGSLNIGGAVLESTTDYRNDEFDLGRTTLTYDKPEKLQRFIVGNISTGSRNFQENLELNGFRISKEFFLDPDLRISPRANESIILDSDSEVELFINNQLVRRFSLREGVYSLEDIGLYDGANNIRVRIKDEFGKVTVKTSKQYYDSHLLKPGLSLFAVSLGYLSNQQAYSSGDLEKTPIFSGYYQKGLRKNLTMSLDAQLSPDNYLLGAESIASIYLGSIKNSLAISGGREKDTGFATSFEFRPNKKHEEISLDTLRQDLLGLDTSSRGLLNSWTISGEFRDKNFSLLNGVDPDIYNQLQTDISDKSLSVVQSDALVLSHGNQLKANIQTNFNLNISENWNSSLNLGVSDYYDAKERTYANLSATRSFDNSMRLSLGGRYDTEDKFSMNLQLSIPFSRKKGKKRKDLDFLVDSRNNSFASKLSVNPMSFVGKNSFGGSLEHNQDDSSRQQNLDLNYRNTNFETSLTARNRYNQSSNNYSQQLDVGFNTSIACVGGSCATSYPINDSFALVSGPSNQTQPIAISSQTNRFKYSDDNDSGLPDNYTALISNKGSKAVVRLDSYRYQNINIDEGTLPSGYDTEKTEFEVFPRYHQGFMVQAGGEPATILDGKLVNRANKPLGYKGGQWVPVSRGDTGEVDSETNTIAFFSNKAGRFRVTSIPAGKYELDLFDYPDMKPIEISVPDLKGEVHKVGNLIIDE